MKEWENTMAEHNNTIHFLKGRKLGQEMYLKCRKNCSFKMILLIITVILTITILGIGCVKVFKYHSVRVICDEIKAGKEIDTNFSNGSTAPLFLDNIAAIMQIDGPKIPLVEACYYRNVQAVSVLLENGADPNFFLTGRFSPLEAALTNGPAGIVDEKSLEIVKMLVAAGCDVNKHASSETVIMHLSSIIRKEKNGDIDILEEIFLYLLDNGAEKNIDVFHNVIRMGNVELVDKLIKKYNFDVNERGHLGQNSLIIATRYSSITKAVEIIQLLLQNGANKNLKDDNGKTAFDYAVEDNNQTAMHILED